MTNNLFIQIVGKMKMNRSKFLMKVEREQARSWVVSQVNTRPTRPHARADAKSHKYRAHNDIIDTLTIFP